MAADFRNEAPQILKEYLFYQETVRARSSKTVNEYFIDLRTFFRYLKIHRGLVPSDVEFDKIKIDDVDLDILKTVTLNDAYEYMNYLVRDRNNKVAARARKCSSLKGYFKFLSSNRKYLDKNPLEDLEMPKKPKKLPKYLTLEQSMELLNSVEGDYKERDYAILTLFLNCGLRVSEMAGLNYTDIRTDNTIRVVGKGNKERVIYLNKACLNALNDYMKVRPVDGVKDKKALFILTKSAMLPYTAEKTSSMPPPT